MKTLSEKIDEGFFRKKEELPDADNPKEIITDIVRRFIFAFDEYGPIDEDNIDYDDFFSKIYDLFDKQEGFDSVHLLYRAWVKGTINLDNIDKYVR